MVADQVARLERQHPPCVVDGAPGDDRHVMASREIGETALHVVGQARVVGSLDDRRERAVDVEREQRAGRHDGIESRTALGR